MNILIYLCFISTGALGVLRMNKDLQYNCYYQILKKYSTKANNSIDYYEENKHNHMNERYNLNVKNLIKTDMPYTRTRREIIMSTAENSQHLEQQQQQQQHRQLFTKTFSSAFAEPRNSGRYRQSTILAAATATPATKPLAATTNQTQEKTQEKTLYRNKDVTYLIIASKVLRPGFVYKISLSVLRSKYIIKAFANISCNGIDISSDTKDIPEGSTATFILPIPSRPLLKHDDCRLRMEGFYLNVFCDLALLHENSLEYFQHTRMILIQTDKPLYTCNDLVRFRVTVTNADFKPFDGIVEILIIDPHQNIVNHWLTQLAASGSIAFTYQLAEQTNFGEWSISVTIAEYSGQQEMINFLVEEYYQTLFEVEIKMPETFLQTSAVSSNIYGSVIITSPFGASESFRGKLRMAAKIYPMGYLNSKALNQYFRLASFDKAFNSPNDFLTKLCEYSKKLMKTDDYHGGVLCNDGNLCEIFVEEFNGNYKFEWPMRELIPMQKKFIAYEVLVIASVTTANDVGDVDEVYFGYAISHLYPPSIHMTFLGGTPQIFKPVFPFKIFVAVEHMNGLPIDYDLLKEDGNMIVSGFIRTKIGPPRIVWPIRHLHMLRHRSGIWELEIDLREDFSYLPRKVFNAITEMHLQANFSLLYDNHHYNDHHYQHYHGKDNNSATTASAELLLLAHYSPRSQYIKVITSTERPTVGEYIIFEITTNFYVEEFHYMILSKNVILHTERESLRNGAKTIALVVGMEMAPVAEIFVWAVTWQGEVVSDSLSFPVIGMFVNNFSFAIRNSARITKFNQFLHEISLDGNPGSYVTLMGITEGAYQMQPYSSRLNYLTIISKMFAIDKNIDKLHKHIWFDDRKEMEQYDAAFYSASSNGIDVNNTSFQSGLIIITDGTLQRCPMFSSRCDWPGCCRFGLELPSTIAKSSQKATRIFERKATYNNFNKFRINRLTRHYKDVIWLWQEIRIASDGHTSFYTKGPPSDIDSWIINGQSTNSEKGIGTAEEIVKFDAEEPLVVNVIMPDFCRLYEYIDVQINILHRKKRMILATILLHNSSDYSVANVHQRFPIPVKLTADERHTIHIPIIVESSGKILINVHVETIYGFSNITRSLNVDNLTIEDTDHRHQRFSHYNSIFLNLTGHQNYIVKYINITKSSVLEWAAYSPGAQSFESLLANDIALECCGYSGTAQDYAFAFAAHLYRLIYTRLTNNGLHNVTAEKDLYQNISHNYQILLSFLRSDGSFSQLYGIDSDQLNSSVWLTSYCLRLFQDFNSYKMIEYIWIDSSVMEKILIWLLDQQTSEGNWLSCANSVDSMDNDLTLTAHVLITLDSMKNFNSSVMTRIEKTKLKAIAWIENNTIYEGQSSIGTYDLAIITYALLLHKSSLSSKVFSALQAHGKRNIVYPNLYWISSRLTNKSELKFECYDSLSIEITAYALHSFLLRGHPDAGLIKNWLILNNLKNDCRKKLSKRALNAAIFALLQFFKHNPERETTEISIELKSLTMPEAQKSILFLNSSNVSQMQKIQFFDVEGKFKISAKGVGYAILQGYHVKDEKKDVENDDDDNGNDDKDKKEYDNMPHLQFPPAFLVRNSVVCRDQFCSRISYTNCIKWSPMQSRKYSDMSILAVTLPSGYRIQQQQLNSYVLSGMAKNLIKANLVETKILFYFAKITVEEVCIKFSIRRWYPITNFTRLLPIRIYEYNSEENFVETIIEAAPSAIHKFDICAVCGKSNCTNCQYSSTANNIKYINRLILGFIFFQFIKF